MSQLVDSPEKSDNQATMTETAAAAEDVSSPPPTREQLIETNRCLTEVLEGVTDVIFAIDRDWRFTYANRRAECAIGKSWRDLCGRILWEQVPSIAGTIFEEQCRRAARDGRPTEFSAFCPALKAWTDTHIYPSATGLSVFLRDVSARQALEERLAQSQRLEALGQLAGGVAHDFNNLLTIIGGYGRMVLGKLDSTSSIRKDLEPIVEAANRASGLTRQLLTFGRRQPAQPKVLDINRLVTKLNRLLRRVIGEDIELRLELRPQIGRVKADPGQLEQILMNLAVNARDAMPRGGTLTIATDTFTSTGDEDASGLAAGEHVLLSVADTGTGMSESVRKHVFEPFFTTKGDGKGTGLGLAMVYGIVKQSGGDIRVESEPGKGACFRLYFPRVSGSGSRRTRERRRRPRRGHETILLVEDDADVRRLASGMLAQLGYKVLEASDGVAAFNLFRVHCDRIKVLVTDVIMPQMSGCELANRLGALCPDLKILLISGYTDDMIARHGAEGSRHAILQKPFSDEELGLRVGALLEESGS